MQSKTTHKSNLMILGGKKAISMPSEDMFTWPIITKEIEEAVLDVLRAGKMSHLDETKTFEREYAKVLGRKYTLACNNGTSAIHCAFYGLGIGVGDEVIAPSMTYWATIAQVYSLGARAVFADIDTDSFCLDPSDIEHRITSRTKAIAVVHYGSNAADMDAIMAIAERRGLKVIEDCSHAHGVKYKGKEVGTFGDVSAFSLMTGKSLAIGEGGIMFTDDQRVYERAILFGHPARINDLQLEDLKCYQGVPIGGYKYRMHQLSSAMGRVQLKLYPQQMVEINKAMNYFCDLIDGTPGIRIVRPEKGSNTTKGGWYYTLAKYVPEELGGLSVSRFSEAVRAEGSLECEPGVNIPLHRHPLFSTIDVYGHGQPTHNAYLPDLQRTSQPNNHLPVTEQFNAYTVRIPWFKHYRPNIIEEHAEAYRKVAINYKDLLLDDMGNPETIGRWRAAK